METVTTTKKPRTRKPKVASAKVTNPSTVVNKTRKPRTKKLNNVENKVEADKVKKVRSPRKKAEIALTAPVENSVVSTTEAPKTEQQVERQVEQIEKTIAPSNMQMYTSQILKQMEEGTFDFLFKIELNRKLSTTHVHKLMNEIIAMYRIIGDKAVAPMYLVRRGNYLYVLDGQHRIQACIDILSKLNMDIKLNFVVLDGDELTNQKLVEVISTFNSSSLKWQNLTYIELFAKMKQKGYSKLLELLTSNKDNKDATKYSATNLAHIYTGSLKGLNMIKKGETLDVKKGDLRKKMFDEIVNLMPPQARKAKIQRAVTNLLFLPEYDHAKFMDKFGKFAQSSIKKGTFPLSEVELMDKMKKLIA